MQDFETTGYFRLPGETQFPGILKFDHKSGPNLTLICDLPFKGGNITGKKYDIILGDTAHGPVTLLHNIVRSVPMGFGLANITVLSSMVISGYHFEKIDDITFSSVSVSYTYLVDWAHKPLSDEELADPWKPQIMDPIDIELDRTSLRFWQSRSGNSQVYRTTVQREVTVSIEPYERFNLDEYYVYFNYHLRNFFTIATGNVNHPVFISAQLSENDPQLMRIYYRVREHFEKTQDVFPHEMLFSLNDVRDDLSICLSNWIDKSEAYSTAHIQYFKTKYQGCLDVETKFLFLAQALERICKTRPGKYRGYQVALKSLCTTLTRDHVGIIERLIPNREEFFEQIMETRNNLSHADQKPNAISSGSEFWQYNQRMTILVQICFLRQMGLPHKKITELILRNREFSFVTGQ